MTVRQFCPTIGRRDRRVAYVVCAALALVACERAAPNRESRPPAPAHAPTAAPAAADPSVQAVPQAAPSEGFTANGDFGYLTEMYDTGSLSVWHEADPTIYSGTYFGEFGDGGDRLMVEVRRASAGGYEVSGTLESIGVSENPPPPLAFGPVPLHLDGRAWFDARGQRATFLRFDHPERGVLKGLLLDELFCEREE